MRQIPNDMAAGIPKYLSVVLAALPKEEVRTNLKLHNAVRQLRIISRKLEKINGKPTHPSRSVP